VLVHGAWASAWVWDPIVGPLTDAGYDTVAVELPDSRGPESESGLEAQACAVIAATEDAAGPLYLVGHSGGGIPVTTAAERLGGAVAGVAFIAGIMLPSGVGFDALRAELTTAGELDPGVDLSGVGPYLEPALNARGTAVPPEAAVAVLFPRAAPAAAVAAARRLQPQWNAGLDIVPVWTPERFGAIPRLYVETLEDRDIPLVLQRHMQRRAPGARVITLDADHAPQLSAPAELVDALVDFFAEGEPIRA
jgi:pimeloyl-ACP methyl ester carboxylesterase